MSNPRKFHPWSWCRDLLSQGGDIYHDRMPGGYVIYSARLDAAARERADELKAHCVPRDVADKMATALHKSIMAMGTVETASEEDDETLGDASDACMEAFNEYKKAAAS